MTAKERVSSHAVLIFLAFGAIYIIWGSTYLLNKIAVAELPPFMLSGFRFTTAAVLIFLWALLRKKSLRISRKQLLNSLPGRLSFSFDRQWSGGLGFTLPGQWFCGTRNFSATLGHTPDDVDSSGQTDQSSILCRSGTRCYWHVSSGQSKTNHSAGMGLGGYDHDFFLYESVGPMPVCL